MIFVAVGTQKFQLNRLLIEIDKLIEENSISEEVFAQIGHADYIPKFYKYERFLDKKTFDEKIKECSLLITHSGVGTIIAGKKFDKPIIVFPRLARFGEHVDDHQMQIAKSFSQRDYVLLCSDVDELENNIKISRHFIFKKYVSQRKDVINIIEDYLRGLK